MRRRTRHVRFVKSYCSYYYEQRFRHVYILAGKSVSGGILISENSENRKKSGRRLPSINKNRFLGDSCITG